MNFIDNFLEKNDKRIFGLDVMRSIAILLVVYGHGVYVLPKSVKFQYLLPVPYIDGVSVFFVLSGFLIGGILLKIIQTSRFTGKDLLNFWIRRWFRTLPNYILVLVILIFFQRFIASEDSYLNYFLFLQNFAWPGPQFFPEAWSLCVEEWFYLLFPLACFALFKMMKHKSKSVLFAAIIFIIVPFALRIYKHSTGITDWNNEIQKVTIMRLDCLMYGIIAAYFFKFRTSSWIKYKNSCLAISVMLVLFLTFYARLVKGDTWFLSVYQFNLESIASMLALPFFTQWKFTRFKSAAFIFTFISIISYSMYLLNLTPVQGLVIPGVSSLIGLTEDAGLTYYGLQYFMFWFFTIVLSFILYRLFEKPMTDLREKF